ncbi:MAG: hypothetical protein M1819_005094 [Sarea resinae]|nr:MAG: hypothetical protein M1819_005094 [Sarea resinae]
METTCEEAIGLRKTARRTIKELSPVDLAGRKLQSNHMSLHKSPVLAGARPDRHQLIGDGGGGTRARAHNPQRTTRVLRVRLTWASLSNLIGMPIVLVMASAAQESNPDRKMVQVKRAWEWRAGGRDAICCRLKLFVRSPGNVAGWPTLVTRHHRFHLAGESAVYMYFGFRQGLRFITSSLYTPPPPKPNTNPISKPKVQISGPQHSSQITMFSAFNPSATLSVFKLLINPSLILPHSTIPTFAHLPIPLNDAFTPSSPDEKSSFGSTTKKVDIRAVVLDKDNCFAVPHSNHVYAPYSDKFRALLAAYPRQNLLIVSNSSGTSAQDPDGKDAALLEQNTGVKVLRHSSKKPSSSTQNAILQHFLTSSSPTSTSTPTPSSSTQVTHPSQIAIVGDRLLTDVMLANEMGAYSIWVRDGVVESSSSFSRLEKSLAAFLLRRGYVAPPVVGEEVPRNPFE